MIVSGVQQSDSVIHISIHVSISIIFFNISFLKLEYKCLGVFIFILFFTFLFLIIYLGILWASWICGLISVILFKKFLAISLKTFLLLLYLYLFYLELQWAILFCKTLLVRFLSLSLSLSLSVSLCLPLCFSLAPSLFLSLPLCFSLILFNITLYLAWI